MQNKEQIEAEIKTIFPTFKWIDGIEKELFCGSSNCGLCGAIAHITPVIIDEYFIWKMP